MAPNWRGFVRAFCLYILSSGFEGPLGPVARRKKCLAFSSKAAKLMKLCDLEGYKRLNDFLKASARDSVYPAICMTEGCDYTTEMEPDQDAGYCEACGGYTVTSALVLAGLI
jgi:hypothetical protein